MFPFCTHHDLLKNISCNKEIPMTEKYIRFKKKKLFFINIAIKTITKQHFSLYNVAPTVYKTQVLNFKTENQQHWQLHTHFKNFSHVTDLVIYEIRTRGTDVTNLNSTTRIVAKNQIFSMMQHIISTTKNF